jgi:hypothetical protein
LSLTLFHVFLIKYHPAANATAAASLLHEQKLIYAAHNGRIRRAAETLKNDVLAI